ncbi:uncharacterized protein [Coffea arabica]|uniref:RNase H type-1 domain-containing protein n=1 Tax=Coffea arabica TaxID=13443 RepID=A0A6P6S9M2_COFAR|nr:uncharacterized protein LOC113689233 [Coffea arabica]XP_027062839.1 uncharacterized protein LOC113689237 [Coffea arabica]
MGFFELNLDASLVECTALGGGFLYDHNSKLVFAYFKKFGDVDVLVVEGLSLLHGLRLCKDKGYSLIHAQVDSQALVALVKSSHTAKWPLCNVLREIQFLLDILNVEVQHIVREANLAADRLAALRVGSDTLFTSPTFLPASIRLVLALDSRSFPYVRS